MISQVKHHNSLLEHYTFGLHCLTFSLRENLTNKDTCLYHRRGRRPESYDVTRILVFVETSASGNISPKMYNKEKSQSQKEKSARDGTSSPVLWQVKWERRVDCAGFLPTQEVSEVYTKQTLI